MPFEPRDTADPGLVGHDLHPAAEDQLAHLFLWLARRDLGRLGERQEFLSLGLRQRGGGKSEEQGGQDRAVCHSSEHIGVSSRRKQASGPFIGRQCLQT